MHTVFYVRLLQCTAYKNNGAQAAQYSLGSLVNDQELLNQIIVAVEPHWEVQIVYSSVYDRT